MPEFEKCVKCDGSGRVIYYPAGIPHPYVEVCQTCRGTGRVPVGEPAPEETEADENRRAFYTGDNT